jgi:hypothetical protein
VSKRGRELAERLADLEMSSRGITKAAGAGLVSRDDLVSLYRPVAEGAAFAEKTLRKVIRDKEAQIARERELNASMAEVLEHDRRAFAAMEVFFRPPPLPQVKPGTLADYTPDEFEIRRRADGMVERQMRVMNGHGFVNGSGGSPSPDRHPEKGD